MIFCPTPLIFHARLFLMHAKVLIIILWLISLPYDFHTVDCVFIALPTDLKALIITAICCCLCLFQKLVVSCASITHWIEVSCRYAYIRLHYSAHYLCLRPYLTVVYYCCVPIASLYMYNLMLIPLLMLQLWPHVYAAIYTWCVHVWFVYSSGLFLRWPLYM